MGFRVQGLGFRVQGLGFRVWGSGFGFQGSGIMQAFMGQSRSESLVDEGFRVRVPLTLNP